MMHRLVLCLLSVMALLVFMIVTVTFLDPAISGDGERRRPMGRLTMTCGGGETHAVLSIEELSFNLFTNTVRLRATAPAVLNVRGRCVFRYEEN